MYFLSYYIPTNEHQRVKQALFNCGAGKIGSYDQCCWEIVGKGQFRPQEGSKPAYGKKNKLTILSEYKVEMVCEDHLIQDILETLLHEHPYEQPAYFLSHTLSLNDIKK